MDVDVISPSVPDSGDEFDLVGKGWSAVRKYLPQYLIHNNQNV